MKAVWHWDSSHSEVSNSTFIGLVRTSNRHPIRGNAGGNFSPTWCSVVGCISYCFNHQGGSWHLHAWEPWSDSEVFCTSPSQSSGKLGHLASTTSPCWYLHCSQHSRRGYRGAGAALWWKGAGRGSLFCPSLGALSIPLPPVLSIAAKCVRLVAESIKLALCNTSSERWCPADDGEVAACEQGRLSLKNKLATHTWNWHFFFFP